MDPNALREALEKVKKDPIPEEKKGEKPESKQGGRKSERKSESRRKSKGKGPEKGKGKGKGEKRKSSDGLRSRQSTKNLKLVTTPPQSVIPRYL